MIDLATLFFWSFLAATILPLGSEPALAVLAYRGERLPLLITVATLGNYLGACTTYWIARKAVEKLARGAEPRSSSARRASELVQRYGAPALLLSWVPIVGDAIVAAAGAVKMRFLPFSIFTAVGKAARYIAVAYAAAAAS